MKNIITLFIVATAFTFKVSGQQTAFNTTAPDRIEKAYLHTDRPFYFPGETIWFKTYITNAHHTITSLSDIAYVQLISPEGSIVSTQDYEIVNGYIYGQIRLDKDWVGGMYTIKTYTNWMRNNGEESLFTKKVTVQKIVQPRLQMKFDFKKEAYGPGSVVNAALKLEDLENNILVNKECSYTLSINGSLQSTKSQQTDKNGVLNIQLKLPENLETVDAIVNVKINHEGNTESISRSVPVTLDNIDLQLLPESGILLGGFINTVAFKAINAYGKPADVSGHVKNEKGQIVSNFASYHNGMGSFDFKPQVGSTYTAHITAPFKSKQVYKLPAAQEKGITLTVKDTTTKDLHLTLKSSFKTKVELCASDVQQTLYSTSLTLEKGTEDVIIPISNFPKGITKITLQSEQGEYLAERLVFTHYNQKLSIEIKTDKESYATREKVDVMITTRDHNGKPTPANLSMAVVDNKLLSFADDRQDTITSYFLMSSELQGAIYKPNFYFDEKEKKARQALDFVLLTHGWRTYLTSATPEVLKAQHKPEQLSLHSGTVIDLDGKPTKAKLLLFDPNSDKVLPLETDAYGNFIFKIENREHRTLIAYNDAGDKLDFKMSKNNTSYSWQNYRERKQAAKIKETVENESQQKLSKPTNKIIKQSVAKTTNTPKRTASVSLTADNALDEVIVTAQGIKREKKALGYAISEVSVDDIEGRTEGDIARVLSGKAAGVAITTQSGSSGSATNVVIRGYSSISGSNQPLFVVDGIPLEQSAVTGSSATLDLNPNSIESVNVIKGLAAATLYGTAGRNGVIVITTKNDSYKNTYRAKKLSKRKFKNYAVTNIYNYYSRNFSESAAFYIPKYDSKSDVKERTDFRPTIYWNPVVQTDKNGVAIISYWNSDETTSFNIVAEGVNAKGQVGHKEQSYSVEKPLSIDFKIPVYMSVGDQVILPITVKNNTNQEIQGTLDVVLPEEFAFAKAVSNSLRRSNKKTVVTIPANGFKVFPVTVVPKKETSGTQLRINVISEEESDFLTRTTTVISPYFPTQASIANSKDGTFVLPISNLVKGTLQADFTVYTDIVGDVMDGVSSLIRQPYGCFEQTSSSTYPNVMILKYLRESETSNPEIEKKALDFIKQGYKRLISFETSQGGFEWFGKTPPHETLTAFGILEFTEMKEVYPDVSQKMIDRTVQWLMSKRDGEGGFHKNKKGYDSFASSPQDVANAYIVYALSASKVNVDFTREYKTAFNDALQSKDSYKMAMMACAATELGNKEDFELLLPLIKANIQKYGFKELPVKNTITRSYGNDKQTETLAFTILALLAAEEGNELLITQAVETLIINRKNGRFGATQATAMSLKALIEYTKTQKLKLINSDDNVTLTINGKDAEKGMKASTNGKVQITDIAQYIQEGDNTILVSFSNRKNRFPYNLNLNWSSTIPISAEGCPLELYTTTNTNQINVGDNLRLTTEVTNYREKGLGMVTAIIGLPSGASAQPWQLKELIDTEKVAFYEVYDNYVVLYWRSFNAGETKIINLDLKAEIAGSYTAPASCTYPYYGEEFKIWKKGVSIEIK